MYEVMVLNQSYMPIAKTNAERAIVLILSDKGFSIKDTDKVLRSQHITINIPEILVLKDCGYFKKEIVPFSRKAVLIRDSWKCVYCGDSRRHLLTLDHVIPRSRWDKISRERELTYAKDSFNNCVCACKDCNVRKSANLPEELGWPKVEPKEPVGELIMNWEKLFDIGAVN